jgi:hypothetical protein
MDCVDENFEHIDVIKITDRGFVLFIDKDEFKELPYDEFAKKYKLFSYRSVE